MPGIVRRKQRTIQIHPVFILRSEIYGGVIFPLLAESNIIRIAILPQMKLIDTKRLIEKLDSISEMEHGFVKEKITAFTR